MLKIFIMTIFLKWNSLILDRLRAAAFQAAARVYPGASPYIYPARTTQGHWDTLVRCTLALPIPTRRVGIVLEYDNNHTYSIVHARKRHLSHRDRSTRCSQFPIFNCKPFQLNTCLYRQSLRFFPTLLPRSRDELKPSVTVREGTHAHACLAVVLSPLF